jgi:hypothetical protein
MVNYRILYQSINSDEPKAEQECEKALAEALTIDPDNVDAL